MKFFFFLFSLFLCEVLNAQSDTIRLVKMNSGHLAAYIKLQNSIDAKIMLESGIPFPILDSIFVFRNKENMNIQIDPSEISMNFNGRKLRCYHQTSDTIFVNHQMRTGTTLIADLSSRGIDMMYPIQAFVNPIDFASCIVELDIQRKFMRYISGRELSSIESQYEKFDMDNDELGKMYSFNSKFSVRDSTGRETVLDGRFIPDLGNVMFLALFENHSDVSDFIRCTNIQLQQGYNKKGMPLPVKVMPVYESVLGDKEMFSNITIITTPFYTQLKSDGFLGLDFLKHFNVVFDFSNNKFYLKRICNGD